METSMSIDPFVGFALGCAGVAAVLLAWYVARQRPLTRTIKIVLLLGIGVLPLATATTGNVAGYNATKTTRFCSSCHVMTPYGEDSWNVQSKSLASRHARNQAFGHENCYACHADYGMFGTVTTKIGGMRHVYEYLFHYKDLELDDALERIEIRTPFHNAACIRCHSTDTPGWNTIPDHASTLHEVRVGSISCASEGCHGPAHPFSKAIKQQRANARKATP
jgi:nitrate/TMAO reductase-like tetraheme cytochrome c subunit